MTEQAATPAADAVQQVTTEAVKQLTADDRLKTILADMVEKAANGMENAVDWTMTQVPDLIHQLLVWNLAINIVWAVVWLLIAIGATIGYVILWKKTTDLCSDDKWLLRGFGGVIYGFFTALVVFNGVMDHATEALKIYLAPKLWLLEYAVHLVKTVS